MLRFFVNKGVVAEHIFTSLETVPMTDDPKRYEQELEFSSFVFLICSLCMTRSHFDIKADGSHSSASAMDKTFADI